MTDLHEAACDDHDIQAADDILITLRVFENKSVLKSVMIREHCESRAAAEFQKHARAFATLGAALGLLRTANGSLTAHVAFYIRISPHHVRVGKDVHAVVHAVVARETEADAACAWL